MRSLPMRLRYPGGCSRLISPLNGSASISSKAASMRCWSRLGSLASSFPAFLVTSRFQFIVKLAQGYIVSAFEISAAFADAGELGFGWGVDRIPTFKIVAPSLA